MVLCAVSCALIGAGSGVPRALAPPTTAAATAGGPAATVTISADSLLDAYMTAIGGTELQAKLYNRVASGKVELVGLGLTGTVTETSQEPAYTRMVMELAGLGRIEGGTDGSTAWESDSIQGARLLEGGERAMALRAAALVNGAGWRDLFPKAEYAGTDSADGRACHKVVLTPAQGNTETWYLDAADHLLRKTSTVVESVMGDVAVETSYSDYRPVDGLLLPHVSEQSLLVQKIRVVYDRIRHNVELADDAFAPPPDVQALLQAPAQPATVPAGPIETPKD